MCAMNAYGSPYGRGYNPMMLNMMMPMMGHQQPQKKYDLMSSKDPITLIGGSLVVFMLLKALFGDKDNMLNKLGIKKDNGADDAASNGQQQVVQQPNVDNAQLEALIQDLLADEAEGADEDVDGAAGAEDGEDDDDEAVAPLYPDGEQDMQFVHETAPGTIIGHGLKTFSNYNAKSKALTGESLLKRARGKAGDVVTNSPLGSKAAKEAAGEVSEQVAKGAKHAANQMGDHADDLAKNVKAVREANDKALKQFEKLGDAKKLSRSGLQYKKHASAVEKSLAQAEKHSTDILKHQDLLEKQLDKLDGVTDPKARQKIVDEIANQKKVLTELTEKAEKASKSAATALEESVKYADKVGSKGLVSAVDKVVDQSHLVDEALTGVKAEATVVSNAAEYLAKGVKPSLAKGAAKGLETTGEAAAHVLAKGGTKAAAKGAGKMAAKAIPVVSLLVGGYFAFEKGMKGDWVGAGAELTSGALSTFAPGPGTIAALAIDGALTGADLYDINPTDAMGLPTYVDKPEPATA